MFEQNGRNAGPRTRGADEQEGAAMSSSWVDTGSGNMNDKPGDDRLEDKFDESGDSCCCWCVLADVTDTADTEDDEVFGGN